MTDWWLARDEIDEAAVEDVVESPINGTLYSGSSLTNAWTVAVIAAWNSTDSTQYIFDSASGRMVLGWAGPTSRGFYNGSVWTNLDFFLDGIPAVYFLVSTGSSIQAYRNNFPIGNASASDVNIGGTTRWGSSNSGTSAFWTGFIAGGAVYNIALDSAQRAALFLEMSNFISSKRTFTASVGWLAPLGIEEVTVEAWGGGGGGSSGNPSFPSSGGGGGGGGAYAKGTVSVTPGGIYAITVGAGGGPSTAGGDSSFVGDNGESVLAKGGSGSPVNTYSRGDGGSAESSVGNIAKFRGGNGDSSSSIINTPGGGGGSGAGRDSDGNDAVGQVAGVATNGGGAGGNGGSLNSAGLAGSVLGGGGGGAGPNNNTAGNGAAGQVTILNPVENFMVVLEPEKDAFLADDVANNNFGASTTLQIGLDSSGFNRTSLLKFDVSIIPSNLTVLQALLQFDVTTSTGTQNLVFYRSLVDWTEGTGNNSSGDASWNERQNGVAWSTAGARGSGTDRETTASYTVIDPAVGMQEVDVTEDVVRWHKGLNDNYGWVIDAEDLSGSHKLKSIASREYTVHADRPRLLILYGETPSEIIGSASGLATAAATLTAKGNISVTDTGSATTTATLRAKGFCTGNISALATASATLVASGFLTGSSESIATVTGDIKAVVEIIAASSGSATTTAVIYAVASLSTAITADATTQATIGGVGSLAAQIVASAAVQAQLSSGINLVGNTSGNATVSAILKATGFLAGISISSANVSATIYVEGTLSGQSAGSATVIGSLSGVAFLAGEAAGSATATGIVRAGQMLSGTTFGASVVVGVIFALGHLSGTIAGDSTVQGTLAVDGAVTVDFDTTYKKMYAGTFKAMR